MIAIADAGGTSTEWRLISNEGISQFRTKGFNLASDDVKQLKDSLPTELFDLSLKVLHFYGAGVSDKNSKTLKDTLVDYLNVEQINVYPDTLAAARGLLEEKSGWVGVLGTGSAVFHYNGSVIDNRIPSLGYLMGDEGSGVALGSAFIRSYLRGHFSDPLTDKIRKAFTELNEANALQEVYQSGNSKGYFSQFVEFLGINQSQEELYQLIYDCLDEFFEKYFVGDKPSEISFSGSIAFHFGNILNAVAHSKSIRINRIIQSPIAGLTLYHQKNG